MQNLSRRSRLAVVPAIVAAFALSACQDQAPTAAPPPTTPAQTAPQTTTQPSTPDPGTTTDTPSTTTTPSTPSGPSTGGSGTCNNTSSFKIDRGTVAAKPLTTPQTANGKSGTVQVSFSQPTVDTAGGDSFFPGEGMQTVIYSVTLKMTGGTFFTTSYLKFGMNDAAGTSCKADVLNAVVPDAEHLSVESLKPGDTLTKKLAYAVPAGADLSKYSLVFKEDYPGVADLAWTAK